MDPRSTSAGSAESLTTSWPNVDAVRLGRVIEEIEHLKASVRVKLEHTFRVVKRQFGHTNVRYRGLPKKTAQLQTLFALTNLWLTRRQLMVPDGQVLPERLKAA